MWVLSRKVGQRTPIGDGIVAQVLEVTGRRVRLGIDAPLEVVVRREELVADQEPAPVPTRPVRKPR
jgi:carbon storage regulator